MLNKWKKFLYSVPVERIVRTAVAAVIGVLVAAFGLDLDSAAIGAAWGGAIGLTYTGVINFLEDKVSSVFGWLLGIKRAYAKEKRAVLDAF